MEKMEVYTYWGYYYLANGLAIKFHEGQVDKAGAPYINHPRRVAKSIFDEWDFDYLDDDEKIFVLSCATVAMLHDVLEDTECTEETLVEYEFPTDIIEGVKSVTRLDGESYSDFVKRASENKFGIKVKYFDLADNLDIKRLHKLSYEDINRINKYLKWYYYLNDKINKN